MFQEGDTQKVNDCKNCLITLCVFHTLLLGRKKFGSQGWSRAYPFNTGDLTISANVLTSFIKNNPKTPYSDLRSGEGHQMLSRGIWKSVYLTAVKTAALLHVTATTTFHGKA